MKNPVSDPLGLTPWCNGWSYGVRPGGSDTGAQPHSLSPEGGGLRDPGDRGRAGGVLGLPATARPDPRLERDEPDPECDLDVVPESVLVIRNDTLVTRDERLQETDVVEIRPVVSGGAV